MWGVTQEQVAGERLIIVSIHTPVWGVTVNRHGSHGKDEVSIHTPVWGVTTQRIQRLQDSVVSIHTPVWGVTYFNSLASSIKVCFNPHARVGRDIQYTKQDTITFCFNPHARVGRDIAFPLPWIALISFNPHARVGRDSTTTGAMARTRVSIHTPVWGVTRRGGLYVWAGGFQSTRPCGA